MRPLPHHTKRDATRDEARTGDGGVFSPWQTAPPHQDDKVAALRALRDAGSGRRGHGDDFYRGVASLYNALVAAGEPSPIKAIAESQPVTISAASKWVTRARALGYLPPAEPAKVSA